MVKQITMMMLVITLIFLNYPILNVAHQLLAEQWQEPVANFTNCQVISVQPNTEEDVAFLHQLYSQDLPEVDFWQVPHRDISNAIIQICQRESNNITNILKDKDLSYSVQIEDVQSIIDNETLEHDLLGRFDKSSTFETFALDHYHTLTEIENYLEMAAQKYPSLMSIEIIGKTDNGKNLKVAKIGKRSLLPKPIIFIESGIHAREWVTVSASLYIIHYLLTSSDSVAKSLLKSYDWHWMPASNPDGYEYTWTKNRLWRKNRSIVGSGCNGVDLNRNFDIHFYDEFASSSKNPCSQLYKGETPFSEKETQLFKNYLTKHKANLKAYVSLHSFSQFWMFPYGYTTRLSKDHSDLNTVARLAVDALRQVHGTGYRYGPIATVIYPTGGSSVDWVYDTLGVKYAYGLELRDNGRYGFLLPRTQIIPTAEELLQGLFTMAKEIEKRELPIS